jgi:hypothetical protein
LPNFPAADDGVLGLLYPRTDGLARGIDWLRAVLLERFWSLLNRQNRSFHLFQPHFRTQNRFTLLLERLYGLWRWRG